MLLVQVPVGLQLGVCLRPMTQMYLTLVQTRTTFPRKTLTPLHPLRLPHVSRSLRRPLKDVDVAVAVDAPEGLQEV